MQKPQINQQIKKSAEEGLVRLKAIEENKGWQKSGDKPCLMHRMQVDGRVASKGEAIVNFTFAQIEEYLQKPDTLKNLNNQLIEWNQILREFPYLIIHMVYKGIWPVANRDVLNITIVHRENENKLYIASKSCNYPLPEVKGVVRAECYIGGWIVDRIDEKSCKVTYISDVDIKGNVPAMIKNKLSALQGQIASRVQSGLKKSKN